MNVEEEDEDEGSVCEEEEADATPHFSFLCKSLNQ